MKPVNCNKRREVLALLAAFGVTRGALAQDAVTSDPRSFRLVLENGRVRVLEYRSGPGLGVCGQGMHYHPERVSVSLTGAKVRILNAKGESVVRDIPAGSLSNASLVVEAPVAAWLGEVGVIFEHPAPIIAARTRHTRIGLKNVDSYME